MRVLVVDDEEGVCWALASLCKKAGFLPVQASDGKAALKIMREEPVDAVLLDIRLPDIGGMEVLAEVRRVSPSVPVVMMTAFATVELAVEAMRNGAYDFITKPFDTKAVCMTLRQALESKRACAPDGLPDRAGSVPDALGGMLGGSEQMQKVAEQIRLVAPTDYTVLITGETGVGKEVVAQAIHRLSNRADGPLVPLDCGSIPEGLVESEMFGHERGAYTGAMATGIGKFEAASGGTLFLDEISNFPLYMQPKLLRVLQERRIYRVGSTTPRRLDIRILATTNESLGAMVQKGRFRRDLYYRVAEVTIALPPLRERRQDICFLANVFLHEAASELGKPVKGLSEEALQALLSNEFPGNVRQLRNVMRGAVLRCLDCVTQQDLQGWDDAWSARSLEDAAADDAVPAVPLKDVVRATVAAVERGVISKVLKRTGGNKAQAARLLGVDYKTILNKVKQYGFTQ